MTWIKRIAVGAGIIVLGLAGIGAVYQAAGAALDRRAVPPPGRLVAIGEHRMHLWCSGEGSPTVVLEAGATGFAQTWAWIQPELARSTRVCSYDRPGLGWSDAWDVRHDATTIARQLRALLAAAGEQPPFVMVGHSLGGSLVRVFAEEHPDEVVALALVDPSHEDQLDRFPPQMGADFRGFVDGLRMASLLSYVGVLRATNLIGRNAAGLPERAYRTARLFASSPTHLRTSHEELAEWDATMDATRRNRSLGDRPLVVLSATDVMEGMNAEIIRINQQMHAELAALSTQGRHLVLSGTDHYSLLMDRADAALVTSAIDDLIGTSRPTGPGDGN